MIQHIGNVSVIICAYTEERLNDLIEAVKSVQQQTFPPCEIIVVIDHNPHLMKLAMEHLLNIVLIENKEARGLSGARNSGIAVAKGNIIAFLDDDAIAEPDWIEHLISHYTDPHIVGVGGKIEPFWQSIRPFWFPDEFNWIVGCTYRGMPLDNHSIHNITGGTVRNIIGANMSFTRNILMDISGFRESFGTNKGKGAIRTHLKWLQNHAGCEEVEFCVRATQKFPEQVSFYYTPFALVWHRVPMKRTRWTYFLWRCYDEGLGKAVLVDLHGTKTGLSSERSYTFKALPRGILHGVADTLLYHDPTGLTRAGAIVVGFLATLSGYIVGRAVTQIKNSFLPSYLKGERQHTNR